MKGLGEIALRLSLYDDARTQFDEALGSIDKWAMCGEKLTAFSILAAFRVIRSQYDDARERFQEALRALSERWVTWSEKPTA